MALRVRRAETVADVECAVPETKAELPATIDVEGIQESSAGILTKQALLIGRAGRIIHIHKREVHLHARLATLHEIFCIDALSGIRLKIGVVPAVCCDVAAGRERIPGV